MKKVTMTEDHNYRPAIPRQVTPTIIKYRKGRTYDRVPEAAVRSILRAGAGSVVSEGPAQGEADERS